MKPNLSSEGNHGNRMAHGCSEWAVLASLVSFRSRASRPGIFCSTAPVGRPIAQERSRSDAQKHVFRFEMTGLHKKNAQNSVSTSVRTRNRSCPLPPLFRSFREGLSGIQSRSGSAPERQKYPFGAGPVPIPGLLVQLGALGGATLDGRCFERFVNQTALFPSVCLQNRVQLLS
jgi:hypothetical protein